jgi:xylulokinase
MTEANVILAHDLGTTGNKATLFDTAAGRTLASTFFPYDTDYPRPSGMAGEGTSWAEQNPADWRSALYAGARQLLDETDIAADRIAAVSFSGHMQGAMLVDREGEPLHPAIIWADQRATRQARHIEYVAGSEVIYRLTGSRVSPAYTTAKLLWIKENVPDVYRRGWRTLQPKDYAAYLFTGVMATDYSDASGTQAMDLYRRKWAIELLHAIGLRPDLFPELHPSTDVIGTVTQEAAAATGLRQGTPVVIGGGDGACATVGAGVVAEGDAYTYVGSSAWIGLSTKAPVFDPDQRTITFAHLDPNLYFPLGNMQAAGGAYGWLEGIWRHPNNQRILFAEMDKLAEDVPVGALGLLFLPHLMGERSPYWNPLARGAFVGLAMPHGRAEMTRAVLEGVAFNLRAILDALRGQGVRLKAMRLIGGGARSPLWRQILADIFQLPVLLPDMPGEATSLGAAVAGAVGVGIFPDFQVVHQLVPTRSAETPQAERVQRYADLYRIFRKTYLALEPIFADLSGLTGETEV